MKRPYRIPMLLSASVIAVSVLTGLSAGRNAAAQTVGNYCRPDGRVIMLLVDVTTPFGDTDRILVVRLIDKMFSVLEGGDRIIVKTISDSYIHSERLIEQCIPFCRGDSSIKKFFDCADGAIRTDRDKLREQFNAALRKHLLDFPGQKRSDIVRTIQSVGREDLGAGHASVIYIYSDLVENSDHLASTRLFSAPVEILMKRLRREKLIAKLENASVRVVGFGRDDSKNREPLSIERYNKLMEFWQVYFKESGAASVIIGYDLPAMGE